MRDNWLTFEEKLAADEARYWQRFLENLRYWVGTMLFLTVWYIWYRVTFY